MGVYLIAMNEETRDNWQALKEHWPGRFHILTPHLALIAPAHLTIVSEIADKLGMTEDERVLGLVVEITQPFTGYNHDSLWEWIENAKHALQT